MHSLFAERLKKLRMEKNISQVQLAEQMFVTQSTIARWENGSRLPDAIMISRLSKLLDVDVHALLFAAAQSEESPNVIIVDDSKLIVSEGLAVLEKAIPNAAITGFVWPLEAIEYAKLNRVALAVLDIELGSSSGLDLCRTLLDINPRTNIVFLTAYADYSLDAWKTEACGFILKPLTPENIKEQLRRLRYPFPVSSSSCVSF